MNVRKINMRAKVTDEGLLIPKQLLEGIQEVEISERQGILTIVPVVKEDPILGLGQNPVACGVPDAAEQLDKYLYGSS